MVKARPTFKKERILSMLVMRLMRSLSARSDMVDSLLEHRCPSLESASCALVRYWQTGSFTAPVHVVVVQVGRIVCHLLLSHGRLRPAHGSHPRRLRRPHPPLLSACNGWT